MLKHSDETTEKRFMPYNWTMNHGGVHVEDYEVVYSNTICPLDTIGETLEAIFAKFNIGLPIDYAGRSVSVSDLITLEGVGTYFCDTFGFKLLAQSTIQQGG